MKKINYVLAVVMMGAMPGLHAWNLAIYQYPADTLLVNMEITKGLTVGKLKNLINIKLDDQDLDTINWRNKELVTGGQVLKNNENVNDLRVIDQMDVNNGGETFYTVYVKDKDAPLNFPKT